jgi:hypothetical protein
VEGANRRLLHDRIPLLTSHPIDALQNLRPEIGMQMLTLGARLLEIGDERPKIGRYGLARTGHGLIPHLPKPPGEIVERRGNGCVQIVQRFIEGKVH